MASTSLETLLTEHDVARITGLSVASVRRWRLLRQGPKYLKIGAAVRYRRAVIEQRRAGVDVPVPQAFEERHYPIAYWARLWGFSQKTVRDWFRDEYGGGILRQPNTGRRSKRDYTTIMISASAAARVYAKRTGRELVH